MLETIQENHVSVRPSADSARHVFVNRFRRYRIEILLFALLWMTYSYFYPSSQHSAAARFSQMRSVWEDHSMNVDKYGFMSADLVAHQGHLYPNKAPGTTLLGLVPFGFWSKVMRAIIPGPSERWPWVAHLTTATSIGLLSALAAVFIYGVLRRATGSELFSVLAIVAIWLGTIAFPYSALFYSHQAAASQMAIAFALLFEARHELRAPSAMRLSLVGMLLGFTVASEYPTILLVGALILYAAVVVWTTTTPGAGRLKALVTLLLWTGLGLSTFLIYNVLVFGEPIHIAYGAYANGHANPFHEHRLGFFGVHWPGWPAFAEVLTQITVRPQRGLLYLGSEGWRVYACNPSLWIAVPGILLLSRLKRYRLEAVMIVVMAAAYLTFNACYGETIVFWGGGTSLGPRHLIPLLPLLALPLAFGARQLPWLFFPLLALSVFYMLIGLAIEPRVPYVFVNPYRDIFLPRYLEGWFSHGRAGLFVPEDIYSGRDTAFNLAEASGIPDRWQLLPLVLMWLAVGRAILREIGRRQALATSLKERRKADNGRRRRARASASSPAKVWSPRWAVVGLAGFTLTVGLTPVVHGFLSSDRGDPRFGLTARYFANGSWAGEPRRVRVDEEIDFDWTQTPPLLPPFSVEWTGVLRVHKAGVYSFRCASDGANVEVDGRPLIQTLGAGRRVDGIGKAVLSEGDHRIRILYKTMGVVRDCVVQLYWTPPESTEEIIPAAVLVPRAATAEEPLRQT